jgi:hypothetical protein
MMDPPVRTTSRKCPFRVEPMGADRYAVIYGSNGAVIASDFEGYIEAWNWLIKYLDDAQREEA